MKQKLTAVVVLVCAVASACAETENPSVAVSMRADGRVGFLASASAATITDAEASGMISTVGQPTKEYAEWGKTPASAAVAAAAAAVPANPARQSAAEAASGLQVLNAVATVGRILAQEQSGPRPVVSMEVTPLGSAVASAAPVSNAIIDPPLSELGLGEKLHQPGEDGVIEIEQVTKPEKGEQAKPGKSEQACPFDVRLASKPIVSDLVVKVGGILLGAKPGALVNGRPVGIGSRIGVCNVHQIRRDGVLLEFLGEFYFVPRNRTVTLHITQRGSQR